jgi:cytochrome c556
MKRLISIGLITALSIATDYAAEPAAPPTPEAQAKTSIETRQGLFKLLSFNMAPIGGMLRNTVPFDAEVVAKNAARIQQLAGMIPDLFIADTRKTGAGVKTAALDGIWTSQADFKAKADAMGQAAGELLAAAKTGDKAATMKAAQGMKACGNCHDTFRLKQ